MAGPKVSGPSLDATQAAGDKGAKSASAAAPGAPVTAAAGNDYSVVSVVYTRGRWVAVLSASSGKLYSVSVGDTLSDDGSTVSAISRAGVTLDKAGTVRKNCHGIRYLVANGHSPLKHIACRPVHLDGPFFIWPLNGYFSMLEFNGYLT